MSKKEKKENKEKKIKEPKSSCIENLEIHPIEDDGTHVMLFGNKINDSCETKTVLMVPGEIKLTKDENNNTTKVCIEFEVDSLSTNCKFIKTTEKSGIKYCTNGFVSYKKKKYKIKNIFPHKIYAYQLSNNEWVPDILVNHWIKKSLKRKINNFITYKKYIINNFITKIKNTIFKNIKKIKSKLNNKVNSTQPIPKVFKRTPIEEIISPNDPRYTIIRNGTRVTVKINLENTPNES